MITMLTLAPDFVVTMYESESQDEIGLSVALLIGIKKIHGFDSS